MKRAIAFAAATIFAAAMPAMARQAEQQGQQASPPAASSPPIAQVQGPSYSDTVAWIQDKMQLSGRADMNNTQINGSITTVLSQIYSVQFDACRNLNITVDDQIMMTDSAPLPNHSGREDTEIHSIFTLPIAFITIPVAKNPNLADDVKLAVTQGDISWRHLDRGQDGDSDSEGVAKQLPSMDVENGKAFIHAGGDFLAASGNPVIDIAFTRPEAAGLAPHMAKALQHLVDICKEHPEQAPKPMF